MPRISKKQKLRNLVLFFGFESLFDQTDSILSDEDFFALMAILESKRYIISRKQNILPQTMNYWVNSLLSNTLSDDNFLTHFRMCKEAFWKIHSQIEETSHDSASKSTLYFQLAVVLYRLGTYGNSSGARHVSSKFGISVGSVYNFTRNIIQALTSLSKKYIVWPNKNERAQISIDMLQERLPKCIGFVDGTDVVFDEAPRENKDAYFSRKKRYSMQVQIICDRQKIVRDLFTGYPGSVHDAKVFANTPIGRFPEKFFSEGEFILGDSAYSLTETVVVPFRRSPAGLSHDQKQFNFHHANNRVRVENCIGLLKERFQSLKGLRNVISQDKGHKNACNWIHACVVLHNMLTADYPWNANQDANTQSSNQIENEEDQHNLIETEPNKRGHFKRQAVFEIYKGMA